MRLPAEVTCTAQGALQITSYDDGVSVGQAYFLGDDEESQNVLEITLSEGKNRHIRRMIEGLGRTIEVLRRIKGEPALGTIPVVVMTSSREDRDVQAAYRLGANAYVVKPMKFGDFVAVVKQVGAFWAILNEPPPAETPGSKRRSSAQPVPVAYSADPSTSRR